MNEFLQHFALGLPLFALILLGYLLIRLADWPRSMAQHLTTFVFSIGLPAMLFRMMGELSHLPSVDSRLLIAFFGAGFIVFALGRLVAWKIFQLDGAGQSVFGIGCIFSNNIMLGLPLAKATLGDAAIPSVALILVFNALILWSLVSISIEWHRHGSLSLRGFRNTLKGVLRNPIILAILTGTAFGYSGIALPEVFDQPLKMLGQTGMPLALVALGMSLADYALRAAWKTSISISLLKLIVLPVIVWGLCLLIGLPKLETRVMVLLASIGLGANVFLMSRQFKVVEDGIAGALILTTACSALTTPFFVALVG